MKLHAKLSVDEFSVDQLLLHVSESIDPKQLDLTEYDEFIASASRGRDYQREAIETALRFLAGGRYMNTEELARESYANSADLQRRYANADRLVERLPFPDRLACSLDLATATGKSFVYHAIARIMLNEGHVDRVLVLCPSLTIEEGLKDKFNERIADSDLSDLLPERTGVRIPDIVDAGSTVKEEQICIENIHATYERTGSSIRDSFAGQGERTLVISDEAHHIYSPSDTKLKRWREFIEHTDYGFRYHLGGSGTCYVKNDYFADVVYRYPIRQAIDDRWIKEVYYLDKDSSATDTERFQKLLARHEKNRKTYAPLKPLTIAITANIKAAEELAEELIAFLAGELKGGRDEALSKVLVVTSSDKHRENVVKLRAVDAIDNPNEWVVSVAMLSEGWDVQNVFQVYPHEKRAFNSKLLISQVLGRGLRRPEELKEQPLVYVFNHQRWGPEIEELVAEVLDVETTIAQRPTDGRACPHIELHDLEFEEIPTGIEPKELEKPAEFGETIALRPQRPHDEKTTFVSVVDSAKVDVLTTRVIDKLYSVDEVVVDVRQRMLAHDKATGGTLAKTYPKKRVERMIVKSLKRLKLEGTELSQENRQLVLSAFGSLRQKTKRPGAVLKREAVGLKTINTGEIRVVTGRISALTSTLGLFYDSESRKLGTPEDEAALRKAREITVFNGLTRISNSFLFKSPTNVVLTSHQPEYQFVERLMEQENADALRAWIKAPDTGFYTIQFLFKKNAHAKRRVAEFNPDFFLWRAETEDVIVVETKMSGDTSPLNKGKLEAATEHFAVINELLEKEGEERRYEFHILAPDDYDNFFDALRNGELDGYVSGLQAVLA